MGSKKADAKLTQVITDLNKMTHAIGALQSCQERLTKLLQKMSDANLSDDDWNDCVDVFKRVFEEMDKKWGECPGYYTKAKNSAAELVSYCEQNMKKHKKRMIIDRRFKKSMTNILEKAKTTQSDIEYTWDKITPFAKIVAALGSVTPRKTGG